MLKMKLRKNIGGNNYFVGITTMFKNAIIRNCMMAFLKSPVIQRHAKQAPLLQNLCKYRLVFHGPSDGRFLEVLVYCISHQYMRILYYECLSGHLHNSFRNLCDSEIFMICLFSTKY